MKCEPCTYLPGSVEDSSQTSFLDIDPSWQLSGNLTPAKSLENEPPKDGSPICQCGKGMSDCLIHPSTPEKWIASMRDSLVRTLALPGIKRALDMRHDPAFIEKSSVLLASFDHDTCSLKTCQLSLVTDSQPYSQTLPRWGSLRNGAVSEHPIAAHRITGTGGLHFVPTPDTMNHRDGTNLRKDCNIKEGGMHGVSLHHWAAMFPTPTVSSGSQVAWDKTPGQTGGTTLAGYVKYWPTPSASDNRDRGNMATPAIARRIAKGKQVMLSMSVSEDSGQLNPPWVEWLMGFPIGFTASKDSVTRKSRCKPQLHGNSLEASN